MNKTLPNTGSKLIWVVKVCDSHVPHLSLTTGDKNVARLPNKPYPKR